MKKEQFGKIKQINEIDGFPFNSFDEMIEKDNTNEIFLGAAMDYARQWVSQGAGVPNKTRRILFALQSLYFLLPVMIIIGSLMVGRYMYAFYAILIFALLMLLRPMALRTLSFLKLIVWGGYLLILAWFIWGHDWQIVLGLTISVAWWTNKIIYNYSVRAATTFGRSSEENFVYLFKHGVLLIKMSDGKLLSSMNFFKID